MENSIRNRKNTIIVAVVVAVLVPALAFGASRGLIIDGLRSAWTRISELISGEGEPNTNPQPAAAKPAGADTTLELTPAQLETIQIGPVGKHSFQVDNETVGSIDFDEDLSVQVFPTYQGTILETFGELAADVQKDQPLYTIKSPDLIQAESTLIGAAATFDLTNKELERAKTLKASDGVSQREIEQAISDQETAEGALKAARDAVRVFGKTDAEIDQMIASRRIDPALVVHSPISGKITARNAQPGFLVQPGVAPAPYTVSDMTLKWMLANVLESDIALFHLGQPVQAKVTAFPNRVFSGKVSKIYATADPNTHRVIVRSEISDPNDELRPGMLATFVIQVGTPVTSVALPANGVVREGDGTMTAWVTTDRHKFTQRVIQVGMRRDNWVQILGGVQAGELVAIDGAVFLSNMLLAPTAE